MSQLVIFIVFFFLGLVSVLGFRIYEVKRIKNNPFIPQHSTFLLKPPAQALTGKIIEVKGEVNKEPRDGEVLIEVKKGEIIVDGEKLKTAKSSEITVEFTDFARVSLGSDAEISFIDLLPSRFLVKQNLGKIEYEVFDSQQPISVRSLNILFTLDEGVASVTTDAEKRKIIIEITDGQGRLAMVDLENRTRLWQLKKGQKALIDDQERLVTITQ